MRIVRNTSLVLLLFIAVLPLLMSELASWGLKHLLRELGAQSVKLDHFWLNPYLGRLELRGLGYRAGEEEFRLGAVQARVSLPDLLSRKARVVLLQVADIDLQLRQQDSRLVVNGLKLPAAEEQNDAVATEDDAPLTWTFAVDELVLQNVGLQLRLGELNTRLQLQRLDIDGLDTSVGQPGTIRLDLQLEDLRQGADTALSSVMELQSNVLLHQADPGWQMSGDFELLLRDAALQAAGVSLQTPQLFLGARLEGRFQSPVEYNLEADITLGQPDPDQAGENATRLKFEDPSQGARLASAIALRSNIQLSGTEAGLRLRGGHQLNLRDLDAEASGMSLQVAGFAVEADTSAELGADIDYELSASAALDSLRLGNPDSHESILQLGALQLRGVGLGTAAPGQYRLSDLTLERLNLGPEAADLPQLLSAATLHSGPALLQLASATQPMQVRVETLALTAGEVRILRDAQGTFPQFERLLASLPGKTAEAENPANVEPVAAAPANTEDRDNSAHAPDIQIAEVLIAEPSRLYFQDRSVEPALKETVSFKEFRLANLHLDGSQAALLKASLGLSHDASLEVSGEINPASLDMDLLLDLKRYQLLQASGYAEQATGYALEAGTLNLDSRIQIADRQMDLKNDILIDQIHLRTASADRAEEYARKLSMPLDQALDLLRNRKGEVKLKLPVTGPLDDPNLQLDEIINKALGGALKSASVTALKFMLQPYSTIFTVAKFAGEQMTRLRLEPMAFSPGSRELDTNALGYADKIAGILKDRDSVQLKLCGVTNSGDAEFLQQQYLQQQVAEAPPQQTQTQEPQQAPQPVGLSEQDLKDQLSELAAARSEALKIRLVKDLQVDKAQLLACLPDHRRQADAIAGVELLL